MVVCVVVEMRVRVGERDGVQGGVDREWVFEGWAPSKSKGRHVNQKWRRDAALFRGAHPTRNHFDCPVWLQSPSRITLQVLWTPMFPPDHPFPSSLIDTTFLINTKHRGTREGDHSVSLTQQTTMSTKTGAVWALQA